LLLCLSYRIKRERLPVVGTGEGFYKFSDIAPIPLTADVLLKAGAKAITDTEYIISKVGEKEPDVYLVKEMNTFHLSTSGGGAYSVSIDYLHQLQNLYYVLTGRDLNLNI